MSENSQPSVLKTKRDALPSDTRRIVRKVMDHIENELIDSLPEILSGVKVTGKQASISPTIAFNWKKNSNLEVDVNARVRAPREGLKFQAHIDDDGQLGLGWNEPDEEPDDPAPAPGFDPSKLPSNAALN